jgi:hypothetical protein
MGEETERTTLARPCRWGERSDGSPAVTTERRCSLPSNSTLGPRAPSPPGAVLLTPDGRRLGAEALTAELDEFHVRRTGLS